MESKQELSHVSKRSSLYKGDRLHSNSILQTAQAFKSQIDSRSSREEKGEGVESQFLILTALVYVRRSLRELNSKAKFNKVSLRLIEDDAYGWPRMRLVATVGGNDVCELTVGAQTRRDGAVVYFKESAQGNTVELLESQIIDQDFTDRTLRALVRTFFESVKKIVSEKESIEKKVASVLQVLSDGGMNSSSQDMSGTVSDAPAIEQADVFDAPDEKKKSKSTHEDDSFDDYDFFSED
jgi:hypothetical protein